VTDRILILTASTGAGHLSAAQALHRAFAKEGNVVQTIDCMDICNPAFRAWYRGGYERLVLSRPSLWGSLYRRSDQPRLSYRFQTMLDSRFMDRLKPLIKSFHPNWVICTHSLPQPRLAELRSEMGFKIAVVVTDLYPHRMWIRGEPDLYCVPTEWSLTELRKRIGLGPEAFVTGIPIADEFGQEYGPVRPESQDGLSVLVTAGGIGGGPLVPLVEALASLDVRLKITAMCGGNESLFQQVSVISTRTGSFLEAVRKVPNAEMASRMRSADILIGKPGGLTTSEALAAGLPFLVFNPCVIPGQEERNAEFLVEIGAGLRADDECQVGTILRDLAQNPVKRQQMQFHAIQNGRPSASHEIVRLVGQR
jgi:processive 1,2-diacylglycerol beta-glucosyltransferase